MMPVRHMRGVGSSRKPRQTAGREVRGAREWWELGEEGTILYGEDSGSTLRLGDPIEVRVGRVEAVRGRVDLRPIDG
jgi:exoribonuclease R